MSEFIEIKCYCDIPGQLPVYSTPGSAGADLSAFLSEEITLSPGQRYMVPTGLRIEIPEGYEAQIRPRSGLAAKHGITLLNTPGTIDSDYRGEIKIIMINLGSEPFTIRQGDRIAQMIIAPVSKGLFKHYSVLTDTDRGEGGFGSTGV